MWEFLRIATTEEGTFYYASPRSAPPTPFKLVESPDKRAVFENKAHDFRHGVLLVLSMACRVRLRAAPMTSR